MTNHGIHLSLESYLARKIVCIVIIDWNNFRMARNQYTGKIREAASTYKTNLALKLNEGIKTDPKSWWQIARQFMGKKKCTCIPAMQCRDHILVENYEKAEEFNNAFSEFCNNRHI